MINLYDYVDVNFNNDIYITGDDFNHLRIINTSNTSIFTRLFFKETNERLTINTRNVNIYSLPTVERPGFQTNVMIPKNIIADKKTNNSFEYIIENHDNTNHVFEAYLIICINYQIDGVSLANMEDDIETYLNPPTLSPFIINENLYNKLNVVKHQHIKYATLDDFNVFVIPLKIHIHPSKMLEPLTLMETTFKYDKAQTKALLRTNPKLTGNIKIVIDEKGEVYLDTFNVDENTSSIKYKKRKVNENEYLPYDIKKHFSSLPKASMYKVKEHTFNSATNDPSEQYNMFYSAGCESEVSSLYNETKKYLAPIKLGNDIPDYFVIFAIDEYTDNFDFNNIEEYFNNSRIVKAFSLKTDSKIGSYLRRYKNDNNYSDFGLKVVFDDYEISKWKGIDYNVGVITNKGEYLYNYIKDQTINLFDFEKHITEGYERHGLLHPNILNLEFLFDDNEAPLNKVVSYFGFYVDENLITKLNLNYEDLGVKTDNIYVTNNITLESSYIDTQNIGTIQIENINRKLLTIKGEDDYFIKIKNVNSVAQNSRLTFQNKSFNLSKLYTFNKSIKQFKTKEVDFDTHAFTIVDIERNTIKKDTPFELKITLPNNVIYKIYSTDIPYGMGYVSYFSHDPYENVYYGAIQHTNQDNMLTYLSTVINNIGLFDCEKTTENVLLIKAKNTGVELNETKFEFYFTDSNKPSKTFILNGASFKGSQFLIKKNDLTYIKETLYFETISGYSKLKLFNNNIYLPYIYDLNTDYVILTLDKSNLIIKIDNEGYVFAAEPIDPILCLFSIYHVVDFDFTLENNNVNNDLLNELNYLDTQLDIDLVEKENITLLHNIHYEVNIKNTIDTTLGDVYLKYNMPLIIKGGFVNINYFELHDNGDKIAAIYLGNDLLNTDIIKLNINNSVTFNARHNLIYYNSENAETGYYLILTDNEIEYLLTIAPINLLLSTSNIDKIIIIDKLVYQDPSIIEQTCMNLIVSNYLDSIQQYKIRIFENDLSKTIDLKYLKDKLYIKNNDDFYVYNLPSKSIIIKNITFEKNNLNDIINNRKTLINNINNVYQNVKDSLILPHVNKWVYYNSTDVYNESYRLNNNAAFGTFGGSPDVKSITPSMVNNTFQWFIIDNKYDINKDTLNSNQKDFITELLYNNDINNKYSYVYKEGTSFQTMFKGVKFNIQSQNDITNYKFSIILRQRKLLYDFHNYEIIKNDEFKTITLIMYISVKDFLFDALGVTYTQLYRLQSKYSHIYYFDTEPPSKQIYGCNYTQNQIIPFSEDDFIYEEVFTNNDIEYKKISIRFEKNNLNNLLLKLTDDPNEYSTLTYIINNTNNNTLSGSILTQTNPNVIEDNILNLYFQNNVGSRFYKIYNIGHGFDTGTENLLYNSNAATTFSLIDLPYRNIYSMVLNSGLNFHQNNMRTISLYNLNEFKNNELKITYSNHKEITKGLFRYDGIFEPKVNNIINFENYSDVIINRKKINMNFKNVELSANNNFETKEYYFNKIATDIITTHKIYHNHKLLKSSLDKEYYKAYHDNTNEFTYINYSKLNKNFFNSLSINTVKELNLYPLNSDINYSQEEGVNDVKVNINFNFNNLIKKYYRNKIKLFNENIDIETFIENNIIHIFNINSIVIYEQNNLDSENNIIEQNINITNTYNTVNFNKVNDTVFLSIIVNKKDYKKLKIEVNIKHK
jgi:hypothetical protein